MTESNQTDEQEVLRAELRSARDRLDQLVEDLRAVDGELDSIETERRQFSLLTDACNALEALDAMGASELFWGGSVAGGSSADQLRVARGRIDQFEKRLFEIEERRQALFDEIAQQQDSADVIAGDVLEAERVAELKKLEWEIEREVEKPLVRPSRMPWARGGEDDQRFRKALAIALLLSLFLGVALPFIEVPLPERWEVLEEQSRLTQLIREELPPVVPVPVPETKPVTPEEQQVATEETPKEAVPREVPVQETAPAATKKKAASKGILAFREEFSSLSQSSVVDRLGSNARIDDSGSAATGLPERSMVTTQAPGSSGGINVAKLSRGTGGTGERMGGVAVTKATSTIGTGGGSDRPLAGGGPGLSRTDEEIQIVFDRHKAALYRLYNRALRSNPTLKGQIVLRMTIQPDGSVSLCELKSTDMKAPELARQVLERVKTFDFGAKDGIPAVKIIYPIDFLPAT